MMIKGSGRGALSSLVNEMHSQSVHLGPEMGELVDGGFLGAPIEIASPVFHQLFDVSQVRTVVPLRADNFIRPAGAAQPLLEVAQHVPGDMNGEGLYTHQLLSHSVVLAWDLDIPRSAARRPVAWCLEPGVDVRRMRLYTGRMGSLLSEGRPESKALTRNASRA